MRGLITMFGHFSGVDEIVAVMAGSMLWMDCSGFTVAKDNLLLISWRKNEEMFYSQINNPTLESFGKIGFATNNTIGRKLGSRFVCFFIMFVVIFIFPSYIPMSITILPKLVT